MVNQKVEFALVGKILRQRDPFLALMSYRATPHTATGLSLCQIMMGREIRTLMPTLEANLKPVLTSHEAVSRKDEKTKAAYHQYFEPFLTYSQAIR